MPLFQSKESKKLLVKNNSSQSGKATDSKLPGKKPKRGLLVRISIWVFLRSLLLLALALVYIAISSGLHRLAKVESVPQFVKHSSVWLHNKELSVRFYFCHAVTRSKFRKLQEDRSIPAYDKIGLQYTGPELETILSTLETPNLVNYFKRYYHDSSFESLSAGPLSRDDIITGFSRHYHYMSKDLTTKIMKSLGIEEDFTGIQKVLKGFSNKLMETLGMNTTVNEDEDENEEVIESNPAVPGEPISTLSKNRKNYGSQADQYMWEWYFNNMVEMYDLAIDRLRSYDLDSPIGDVRKIDAMFHDGYDCSEAYDETQALGTNLLIAVAIRVRLIHDYFGIHWLLRAQNGV